MGGNSLSLVQHMLALGSIHSEPDKNPICKRVNLSSPTNYSPLSFLATCSSMSGGPNRWVQGPGFFLQLPAQLGIHRGGKGTGLHLAASPMDGPWAGRGSLPVGSASFMCPQHSQSGREAQALHLSHGRARPRCHRETRRPAPGGLTDTWYCTSDVHTSSSPTTHGMVSVRPCRSFKAWEEGPACE